MKPNLATDTSHSTTDATETVSGIIIPESVSVALQAIPENTRKYTESTKRVKQHEKAQKNTKSHLTR